MMSRDGQTLLGGPPGAAWILCIVLACCGFVAAAADPADPAGGEPRPQMNELDPADQAAQQPAPEAEKRFERGKGGGLAILPAVCWCLLLLGWAGTTGWAGRDDLKLPKFTDLWLPILVFPVFLAGLIGWWVPWSALACGLLAVAWLGSFLTYAKMRDAKATPDRVILTWRTPARAVAPLLRRVGIKLDLDPPVRGSSLPDIAIAAVSADPAADAKAILEQAAALPGFDDFRELMQRSVAMRAQQTMLDIDQQGAKVRQRIDGIWHPARELVKCRQGMKVVDEWQDLPPIEKESLAALLAAARTLCGLPPKAAKRQTGRFLVTVDRKQLPCNLTLEAANGSMRMLVEMEMPPPTFPALAALGMQEQVAGKIKTALTLTNGLIVVSAPTGEGLTTTFTQVVLAADRLLRDFVILEDAAAPLKEIQNVKPVRWGGAEQVTPAAALEAAMRGYPTAVVVPELRDGALAVEVAKLSEELLVIVGLEAADAVTAVEKLLALGMPREVLSKTLQASVSQRLVRRLCPKCAEEYKPTPELLARLKLPAVEALTFKRAIAEGCPACSGTGHLGRTGIYEVAGGPTVSKAIAAKVDRATMLKAAVRDGMQRLTEAGIGAVVERVVGLDEIPRIFKKG